MTTRLLSSLAAMTLLACGGDGNGTSGPASGPAAPTNVVITIVNGEIKVTWDPVAGAQNYNVYMASQAGVTRANYATLPGNMFHPGLPIVFDHPPGLDPNTLYHFVVTAVNGAGESIESCEASAQIGGAIGGVC
ncbi:MAG: fibronectin type III domain-containing protein [Gemmatimonadales bacterium]